MTIYTNSTKDVCLKLQSLKNTSFRVHVIWCVSSLSVPITETTNKSKKLILLKYPFWNLYIAISHTPRWHLNFCSSWKTVPGSVPASRDRLHHNIDSDTLDESLASRLQMARPVFFWNLKHPAKAPWNTLNFTWWTSNNNKNTSNINKFHTHTHDKIKDTLGLFGCMGGPLQVSRFRGLKSQLNEATMYIEGIESHTNFPTEN